MREGYLLPPNSTSYQATVLLLGPSDSHGNGTGIHCTRTYLQIRNDIERITRHSTIEKYKRNQADEIHSIGSLIPTRSFQTINPRIPENIFPQYSLVATALITDSFCTETCRLAHRWQLPRHHLG